jgi:hypothetical protein
VGLKELQKIDSPEVYSQNFTNTFQKKIIHSIKGVGGIEPLKSMNQIKLIQIVSIDGDRVFYRWWIRIKPLS